jgi:Fe-S-cluster containining protein
VFLTKADRARISLVVGKKVSSFARYGHFEFTRFTPNPAHQWYLDHREGNCVFFKEGKCSIYQHRPIQCRTFPYWPEVSSRDDIQAELAKECPGIGQGDDSKARSMEKLQFAADMELKMNTINN